MTIWWTQHLYWAGGYVEKAEQLLVCDEPNLERIERLITKAKGSLCMAKYERDNLLRKALGGIDDP